MLLQTNKYLAIVSVVISIENSFSDEFMLGCICVRTPCHDGEDKIVNVFVSIIMRYDVSSSAYRYVYMYMHTHFHLHVTAVIKYFVRSIFFKDFVGFVIRMSSRGL